VAKYQFTREAQDQFAIASTTRAKQANEDGSFDWEMAPVTLPGKAGDTVIKSDEQPFKAKLDKIPGLKPAFKKDGTITAANASSISDGAAALVITRQSVADRLGVRPVARIVAHAAHAQAPNLFTTAPVPAVRKALAKAGWEVGDVDLYEVNEAFACVAMIAMRDLGIPRDRINVHGGATALGHPIGASGARILATLLSALQTHGGSKGLATLCIGGGEATAMAVELMD
jgi:acetyl-CoA C-acetyltransferase